MDMLFSILIVAAGYVAATWAAGELIAFLLKLILRSAGEDENTGLRPGIRRMGKYIGWLERVLTVTFVLLGHYNGIGFVLAAKSILRYGEIKSESDHKLAEYVIVGTLLSFSLAVMLGAALRWLLGLPIQNPG